MLRNKLILEHISRMLRSPSNAFERLRKGEEQKQMVGVTRTWPVDSLWREGGSFLENCELEKDWTQQNLGRGHWRARAPAPT